VNAWTCRPHIDEVGTAGRDETPATVEAAAESRAGVAGRVGRRRKSPCVRYGEPSGEPWISQGRFICACPLPGPSAARCRQIRCPQPRDQRLGGGDCLVAEAPTPSPSRTKAMPTSNILKTKRSRLNVALPRAILTQTSGGAWITIRDAGHGWAQRPAWEFSQGAPRPLRRPQDL
jgi:hypothetical protein